MIKLLLFAAPPILPYADLLQLVSPAFDQPEREVCRRLDRQLIKDDHLHESVRVIYLASRPHGKFEAGVFCALVFFKIIVTIATPITTSEGAIYRVWEERPNVAVPFLFAEELPLAQRAHMWLGVRCIVELGDLTLGKP